MPPFDVPTNFYGQNGPVSLYFDPAITSNPRALPSLDATFPALANNYADVEALFGSTAPGAAPCNVIITATGAIDPDTGQPIFGGKTDGTGGAYHYATNPGDFPPDPGWDIYVDLACDATGSPASLIHSWLFIAELVESFETLQTIASPTGFAWGPGWSNGEALSRFIAEILVGGLAGPIQQFSQLFETGKYWYNAGTPDWINQTQDTDINPISVGCGVVYMWWLMVTKGISPADICQATCDPNGNLSDHYNTLRAKYPSRFPVTGLNAYGDLVTQTTNIGNPPDQPITGDNPWRIVTYPNCSGCCTPPNCCGACPDVTPQTWTVTLSGFSDAGIWGSLHALSSCNGTWTLTLNQASQSVCTWELHNSPGSGTMTPIIILVAEGPSSGLSGWYLTIGAYGTISNVLEFSHQWQYHASATSDCLSAITLSSPVCESSTTDGDCSGTKPDSITVMPTTFVAGCSQTTCQASCGSGTIKNSYIVSISGFGSNACSDLTAANGTHTLLLANSVNNICDYIYTVPNVIQIAIVTSPFNTSGWNLQVSDLSQAPYTETFNYASPILPNCDGPITFTFNVWQGQTCNQMAPHPTTITVT